MRKTLNFAAAALLIALAACESVSRDNQVAGPPCASRDIDSGVCGPAE